MRCINVPTRFRTRLQRAREHRRRMTAAETGEQREARLQVERDRRRLETAQQREARLQRIRERRVLKRQNRQSRQQQDADRHRQQRGLRPSQQSQVSLFGQPWAQSRMRRFHQHMACLEYRECTTCAEAFPQCTISV